MSNDILWLRLTTITATLLWFHPLAWRVCAAHRRDCEEVSDAVAADYIGDSRAYSQTLARSALAMTAHMHAPGGLPMIRSANIARRLAKIRRGLVATALPRRWVLSSLAISFIALGVLSSLRVVQAQREELSSSTEQSDSASSDATDLSIDVLIESLLEPQSPTASLAWSRLSELRPDDLRVLVEYLDRTEIIYPPAPGWLPPDTGWFPVQAFTHHLSMFSDKDKPEFQEALTTGQPLGHVLKFFLKIATGAKGSDYSKKEWLNGIQSWEPYAPAPEQISLEPMPVTLDVPRDYENLSSEMRRKARYSRENMISLSAAFKRVIRTELAREGLVGHSSLNAYDISDDLSSVFFAIRIRRGMTSESSREMEERATEAEIFLHQINFWNPEERLYRLDLKTGEYKLLARSPGTYSTLRKSMDSFVRGDNEKTAEL